MTLIEQAKTIRQLSERALLLQFVEECSEAAQAAAKLVRILDGENPTPVTEEEARKHLIEEIADIQVVEAVLDVDPREIDEIYTEKMERWADRLREAKPDGAFWSWNQNGMDWGLGAWECTKCGCANNNLPSMANENLNPMNFAGSKFCPQCGKKILGALKPKKGAQ